MAECDKKGGDIKEFAKELKEIESYFYKACELGMTTGRLSTALIWRRLHVTPEMATLLYSEMQRRGLLKRPSKDSIAELHIKSMDEARW